MLKEKYKIRITTGLENRLIDDMKRFHFYKPNGTLNKNKFYSNILKGMITYFKNEVDVTINTLDEVFIDDKNEIRELANRIIINLLEFHHSDLRYYHPSDIYIQTTKENSSIIRYIEDDLLKEHSFSEFVRCIFNQYINLPLNIRVMIAKADIYKDIDKAMKESKEVIIYTFDKKEIIVRPYLFCLE